jgi:hypothetical protein
VFVLGAIPEATEVELLEVGAGWRNEDAGDLRALERADDRLFARGPHDDRGASLVSRAQALEVGDVVEDERLAERERGIAFDDDLGDAPTGRSEPALPHSSMVSPGAGARISTPEASARS